MKLHVKASKKATYIAYTLLRISSFNIKFANIGKKAPNASCMYRAHGHTLSVLDSCKLSYPSKREYPAPILNLSGQDMLQYNIEEGWLHEKETNKGGV